MRSPDRHVGERPGAGHDPLVADLKGDLAFEYVEAFLLSAVDVRRWSAARLHDRLPHGVLAARVLTHGKEAVHVADDGDGSALPPAVSVSACVSSASVALLLFTFAQPATRVREWIRKFNLQDLGSPNYGGTSS